MKFINQKIINEEQIKNFLEICLYVYMFILRIECYVYIYNKYNFIVKYYFRNYFILLYKVME